MFITWYMINQSNWIISMVSLDSTRKYDITAARIFILIFIRLITVVIKPKFKSNSSSSSLWRLRTVSNPNCRMASGMNMLWVAMASSHTSAPDHQGIPDLGNKISLTASGNPHIPSIAGQGRDRTDRRGLKARRRLLPQRRRWWWRSPGRARNLLGRLSRSSH